MTEHLISNPEVMIRSIDIYYHIWQGGNMLLGLIFKDKDDNILLQCGYFEQPNDNYYNSTVPIDDDERIVGVRSKTRKNGVLLGAHYDI